MPAKVISYNKFWFCLIFCEKYNLPSSLHYAVTRRRRIARNLLANLRTSGFVSLRRDKHLLKKYTLPRRSLCGAGSFRFALIYLRPCITLHPPTGNRQFRAQLLRAGKSDKITFSKIKFFTLKNRGNTFFLINYGISVKKF